MVKLRFECVQSDSRACTVLHEKKSVLTLSPKSSNASLSCRGKEILQERGILKIRDRERWNSKCSASVLTFSALSEKAGSQ